jgi:hypothetical protein
LNVLRRALALDIKNNIDENGENLPLDRFVPSGNMQPECVRAIFNSLSRALRQ